MYVKGHCETCGTGIPPAELIEDGSSVHSLFVGIPLCKECSASEEKKYWERQEKNYIASFETEMRTQGDEGLGDILRWSRLHKGEATIQDYLNMQYR